jgi:exonuclease III
MRRVRKLIESCRLRVDSCNVGSLTDKLQGVVDIMIMLCVHILCVQEMKWKRQKMMEVEVMVHRHCSDQEWSRHRD